MSESDTGSDPRSPHIAQEADFPGEDWHSPDGAFESRTTRLGRLTGGRMLGCSLDEVPPGKRSCPYHYHEANEEAMYVLAGTGTLRLGGASFPIAAGDYVTFPTGPAGAHQVHNTSTEPLRVLMMSTMVHPDITVYPDSGKIGLYGGAAPGSAPDEYTLKTHLRADATVDYWEGE